jgi:polysaccharide biosynthesis PFTS motif protein
MSFLKRWAFLQSYVKRRKEIKGLKEMTANHRLEDYHRILMEMNLAPMNINEDAFAGILPKNLRAKATHFLRQKVFHLQWVSSRTLPILVRHLGDEKSAFTVCAPPHWRNTLSNEGVLLSPFKSSFLWWIHQLGNLKEGYRYYLKALLKVFGVRQSPKVSGSYIVFTDLVRANLPANNCQVERSYDLVSWWHRSDLCASDQDEIWISGGIEDKNFNRPGMRLTADIMPMIPSRRDQMAFLCKALLILIQANVRAFLGQWWASYLLREALEVCYYSYLPASLVAREYYFHCGNASVRPLWTYLAEGKGANLTVLEYSHTIRYGYIPDHPEKLIYDPGYIMSNWPRHIVLSQGHKEAIEEATGGGQDFTVVGEMGWRDNGAEMPKFDRPAICVFDTNPNRLSLLAKRGQPQRYHSDVDVVLEFLEHTFSAIRKAGAVPVYKPKFVINRNAISTIFRESIYPKQAEFISLIDKYECIVVDREISANRIIASCDGLVALPFSSAAVNGAGIGVSSAIYDVRGILQGFNRFAEDSCLVHCREDLDTWVKSVVDKVNSTDEK